VIAAAKAAEKMAVVDAVTDAAADEAGTVVAMSRGGNGGGGARCLLFASDSKRFITISMHVGFPLCVVWTQSESTQFILRCQQIGALTRFNSLWHQKGWIGRSSVFSRSSFVLKIKLLFVQYNSVHV